MKIKHSTTLAKKAKKGLFLANKCKKEDPKETIKIEKLGLNFLLIFSNQYPLKIISSANEIKTIDIIKNKSNRL